MKAFPLTLSNIKLLPLEIEKMIESFIPLQILYQLTKRNYIKNYKCIKQWIHQKNQYENYVRDSIRKNHDFVFYFIIKENYNHWIQRRKYHYKDLCYKNYMCFLEDFCVKNYSTKCRAIIQDFNKRKLRKPHK
jgi:hypothetical protein